MRGERLREKVTIWKARCLRGQLFNKGAWDAGGILENQVNLQGRQGQKASAEHSTSALSQGLQLLFLVSIDLQKPDFTLA